MTNVKSKCIKEINSLIRSGLFEEKLASDFFNFVNLKLEFHIRNSLVELFNITAANHPGLRAFAEHPRYSYRQDSRDRRISIDFSVCDNSGEVIFTMELRYHFPGDYAHFKNYSVQELRHNSFDRKWNEGGDRVDAFLLVVCDIDRGGLERAENHWKLNKLSRYQARKPGDDGFPYQWEKNIDNIMKTMDRDDYEVQTVKKCIHPREGNVRADFHFFLVHRKF